MRPFSHAFLTRKGCAGSTWSAVEKGFLRSTTGSVVFRVMGIHEVAEEAFGPVRWTLTLQRSGLGYVVRHRRCRSQRGIRQSVSGGSSPPGSIEWMPVLANTATRGKPATSLNVAMKRRLTGSLKWLRYCQRCHSCFYQMVDRRRHLCSPRFLSPATLSAFQ